MPTTGWFMQTSGSARKRVSANKGTSTQGLFDVSGVPGHTHNSSAVLSVDADYSRYREVERRLLGNVWVAGPDLVMPAGLLGDSVEPDNADERYDRAIERCVGYIVLTPENCHSHIREPTRSIGEIRTLVAPKARLDTLTYVEELRGWRVPVNADDEKVEQAALAADFPDIHIDMLPLSNPRNGLDSNYGTVPRNLYIKTGDIHSIYDVRSVAETGGDYWRVSDVAHNMDGSVWDNTIRFKWTGEDATRPRRYVSEPKTVRLASVHLMDDTERDPDEDGNGNAIIFDGAAAGVGAGHYPQLVITFPEMETTVATDGYCWLINDRLGVEEATELAIKSTGNDIAFTPKISMPAVYGEDVGPFHWFGMPAYRIPVGGAFAHPAADILPNNVYSYWDKMFAFTETDPALGADSKNGLLKYAYEWAEAERHFDFVTDALFQEQAALVVAEQALVAALLLQPQDAAQLQANQVIETLIVNLEIAVGNAAELIPQPTADRRGPDAMPFDFDDRQYRANGMMFEPRAAGLLSQVSAGSTHKVHLDVVYPYETAYAADVPAGAIQVTQPGTLRLPVVPVAANSEWEVAYPAPAGFSGHGTIALHFDNTQAPWQAYFAGAHAEYDPGHAFLTYPARVQYFHDTTDGVAPYAGDYRDAQKRNTGPVLVVAPMTASVLAVGEHIVRAEYNINAPLLSIQGNEIQRYDNTNTLNQEAAPAGVTVHVRVAGLETMIEHPPGLGAQILLDRRNLWKATHAVGNRLSIRGDTWYHQDDAGNALFSLIDVMVAIDPERTRIFFTTVHPPAAHPHDRGMCFWVSGGVQNMRIIEQHDGAALDPYRNRVMWVPLPVWTWDHGNARVRRVQTAELNYLKTTAVNANLTMTLLGPEWVEAYLEKDGARVYPYYDVEVDSRALGAVYQSKKRISQHICAPVLNPNNRIGAGTPLNHDSRHLPPEMRDFRLKLDEVDWSRLGADNASVTLNELTLFEFDGGNQKASAEGNLLYLPQFQEFSRIVPGITFELDCFSSMGSPSFFCFFCRSEDTDLLQQPMIRQLSIFNNTTKKKSNTITEATVGQLYHLTQRNTHPYAEYDRKAFNRRQTILLSSEDVGLMGLNQQQYQKQKRVQYVIRGTLDRPGKIYVVFVFNNRGLHVDGRRLNVVTLHE